jgi:Uncharacterized protein conserved in bacteria (DUF2188)
MLKLCLLKSIFFSLFLYRNFKKQKMTRTKYHVTFKDGEWKGKKEGADRASVTGGTKEEVMQKTINFAKNQDKASVIIHKKDAKFQEERTYGGGDPFPPKG